MKKINPNRPMKTAELTSPSDSRLCKLSKRAVVVAAILCVSMTAWGTELISVRIGPHKNFDRMVFEFDAETPSTVHFKDEQRIEVLFKNVGTIKGFALPVLPNGLVAIRGIDAYRVGSSDIAFEITLSRGVTPSELPLSGSPYRLAVDLAPKVASKADDKPEYIPGDKPIPTRFAEGKNDGKADESSSDDPAKANSILAYYYLSQGDTEAAQKQAQEFNEKTGQGLDIPSPNPTATSPLTTETVPINVQQTATNQAATWLILLMATIAGLIGGACGAFLVSKMSRKSSVSLPKTVAASPRELSDEIQSDLAALKAKVSETAPPKAVAVQPVMAVTPEPELMDKTEESQESLMDRRVRRVLDLSQQGKTVAEIAESLEMAQDEVKLILDLNM